MLPTARDVTLSLLEQRGAEATICPSEVARAIAGGESQTAFAWRGQMPAVHDAVDGLLADKLIQLTWKGRELAAREGPYRISKRLGRS